jgi:hypothetical protein
MWTFDRNQFAVDKCIDTELGGANALQHRSVFLRCAAPGSDVSPSGSCRLKRADPAGPANPARRERAEIIPIMYRRADSPPIWNSRPGMKASIGPASPRDAAHRAEAGHDDSHRIAIFQRTIDRRMRDRRLVREEIVLTLKYRGMRKSSSYVLQGSRIGKNYFTPRVPPLLRWNSTCIAKRGITLSNGATDADGR